MPNTLYYGDNLDVLRKHVRDETVDLCYIDPPFNSKRQYFQIYNDVGGEDRAQAQAFTDTWEWDEMAISGLAEILDNKYGRFSAQNVELIKGLHSVLKESSLLAYLISMTLRLAEIRRVLKPTGSFYLHCDPTASHYLKLVLDAVFCSAGGDFLNEIIWYYGPKATQNETHFQRKHDVVFFYTKSPKYNFNTLLQEYSEGSLAERDTRYKEEDEHGKYRLTTRRDRQGKKYRAKVYLREGVAMTDVWDINIINATSKERLGYPTQKPEALLERIIEASSREGDLVLDAYCGCGTTVAVAQRLKRRWIGMDITYQSISVVLRRLERAFGAGLLDTITLNGIPRDMESAVALAHKKDDRVRKEFEKWALLTYTNNRAIVNEKKGADQGIDGTAYFQTTGTDNAKIIFQVKSGGVKRSDIATLRGDMEREKAEMAILITLEPATGPMEKEAKAVGHYYHESMARNYDRIQIVTVEEILSGARLEIPMSLEVLREAERQVEDKQLAFDMMPEVPPDNLRLPVAEVPLSEEPVRVRRGRAINRRPKRD